MPASIGVNLRVTGHCSQGGRKYMEDLFSVAYQQTEDERDLEYAFFGIYDGHGGSEAAAYAKEHLMDSIVKQRQFWSDNDEDVLKAIRNGYMLTHLNMWKELEKWPKTVTGLPSTAGTTASIAFIRRGKIYIGHVGDSAIVLGYQKDDCEEWAAKPLTCDHKPESTAEIERIQRCGGKVVSKAGVPRVVWNRPRLGHKGPIKKNTPMDEIPFLAVARSLGDLWSYNPHNDEFIVSPDPDVGVLTIDPSKFRCLVFGTDGLWNMISPAGAVRLVQATERHNEAALLGGGAPQPHADWLNPSKSLVDHALERWSNTRMRADNTSVVTLMLDPPGPPRATVLRSRTAHKPAAAAPSPHAPAAPHAPHAPHAPADPEARPVPQNGLTIMTRYSDVDKPAPSPDTPDRTPLPPCASLDGRFSLGPHDEPQRDTEDSEDSESMTNYGNPAESYFMARLLNRSKVVNTLSDVYDEIVNGRTSKAGSEVRETSPQATALEAGDADRHESPEKETRETVIVNEAGDSGDVPNKEDVGIQINEVSSSSPTEAPPRPRGRRPKSEAKRESAAPNDRVLRSHHDAEPPRPHTRRGAARARPSPAVPAPPPPAPAPLPPPPPPPPAADRVVILSRRAPPPRRAATADPPPPPPPDADRGRATRSQHAHAHAAPAVAVAQKAARGLKREGNCARGAEARRSPARGCKENRGAAPRRACPAPAAPPAPPPPPPPPPPPGVAEVHSTTGEHPRALRSRNDAEAPPAGGKRARCEAAAGAPGAPGAPGAGKAARLAGAPRALGKRSAAGPWAPALALRNRLRKRLAK